MIAVYILPRPVHLMPVHLAYTFYMTTQAISMIVKHISMMSKIKGAHGQWDNVNMQSDGASLYIVFIIDYLHITLSYMRFAWFGLNYYFTCKCTVVAATTWTNALYMNT